MRYLVMDDDRRAWLAARLDDQPVHGLDAIGLAQCIRASLDGGHVAHMAILAAPPTLQILAVRGLADWCGWILEALGGTRVPVALSLRDNAGFRVCLHRGTPESGTGKIIAMPVRDLARDPADILDRLAHTVTLSLPDRLAYAFHDPPLAPPLAMLDATAAIRRIGGPARSCIPHKAPIFAGSAPDGPTRLVVAQGASLASPSVQAALHELACSDSRQDRALAVIGAGDMTGLVDPDRWRAIYPVPSPTDAAAAIPDVALEVLLARFDEVVDLSPAGARRSAPHRQPPTATLRQGRSPADIRPSA